MNPENLISELEDALQRVEREPSAVQLLSEKALLRAQRNGWLSVMARAHFVKGWACFYQNSERQAVDSFYKAMLLYKDVQQGVDIAQCYYALGRAYVKNSQYSLALEHYRKALVSATGQESLQQDTRIALVTALMNYAKWTDAEQEIITVASAPDMSDAQALEYQWIVLRLSFYRGDYKAIKEQLKLCQSLAAYSSSDSTALMTNYYLARFESKFGDVKKAERMLSEVWRSIHSQEFSFLVYEAVQDLLRSDYPKKGITFFETMLQHMQTPALLKVRIHRQLAHFYAHHHSFETATTHHQAADKIASHIYDQEVNEQWARFQLEEDQQALKKQIESEKKTNYVLAESNALLQVVNRIALAVNSAIDYESLLVKLKQQLSGWIDAQVFAVAEVKDHELEFKSALFGEKRLPEQTLPLTEDRAWSVRAVKQGRILYDNDFVLKDEPLMDDSPNLVRSVAFIPLKFEHRVLGLLTVQSQQANVFDSKGISLLEYIAPVVGIAFSNLLNLQRSVELSGKVNKQEAELKDVRSLVEHLNEVDETTGLPRLKTLISQIPHWFASGHFHVLTLAVKNLSELTRHLGFGSDDEIIKVIAQRLSNRLRPEDYLSRANSNQFILLVPPMKSSEVLADFAKQLKALVEQPLRAKDQTINAEVAVGIVSFPEHGDNVDELMSMASIAVGHAIDAIDGLCIID